MTRCNAVTLTVPLRQDDVRRERDQFRRVSVVAIDIVLAPASVDPNIAAVGPAQLLQDLPERCDAGLTYRIVRGRVHEHTDAPHRARAAARAPRAATQSPHHRAHREIPAAASLPLARQDRIVSAQTSALIGLNPSSLLQHEMLADVALWVLVV